MKNNNEFKLDFYRIYKRYPEITDTFKIIRNHGLFFLYLLRTLKNFKPYKIHLIPLKVIEIHMQRKYGLEISEKTILGEGIYIGHAYNITINSEAILGNNINIHKGVTIGQENRGKRKGTPIIGNNVYLGINSIVTGKILIGDNVLIAPNTHVNINVPNNSIVVGSPCKIIENKDATKEYVNNKI